MGSSESTQAAFSKSIDSIDATTSVSVDDFELLKKVGEGAFASVWMARTKRDGRKVAVKMQDKAHVLRTGTVKGVVAERDILASIRHPFVVRLLWAFQNYEYIFLVLTWVDGGDLFLLMEELRRPFSEAEAGFYVAEITLALEHLHTNGITFRDLKPENVLCMSDGHLMLTDFGLARDANSDERGNAKVCGTPEFMSPEQWLGGGGAALGAGVDWWALGCLVFLMVTGVTPFIDTPSGEFNRPRALAGKFDLAKAALDAAEKQRQRRERAAAAAGSGAPVAAPAPEDAAPSFSAELHAFIDELLVVNASRRIGAPEAGSNGEAVRAHAWFARDPFGARWSALLAKEIDPPLPVPERDWMRRGQSRRATDDDDDVAHLKGIFDGNHIGGDFEKPETPRGTRTEESFQFADADVDRSEDDEEDDDDDEFERVAQGISMRGDAVHAATAAADAIREYRAACALADAGKKIVGHDKRDSVKSAVAARRAAVRAWCTLRSVGCTDRGLWSELLCDGIVYTHPVTPFRIESVAEANADCGTVKMIVGVETFFENLVKNNTAEKKALREIEKERAGSGGDMISELPSPAARQLGLGRRSTDVTHSRSLDGTADHITPAATVEATAAQFELERKLSTTRSNQGVQPFENVMLAYEIAADTDILVHCDAARARCRGGSDAERCVRQATADAAFVCTLRELAGNADRFGGGGDRGGHASTAKTIAMARVRFRGTKIAEMSLVLDVLGFARRIAHVRNRLPSPSPKTTSRKLGGAAMARLDSIESVGSAGKSKDPNRASSDRRSRDRHSSDSAASNEDHAMAAVSTEPDSPAPPDAPRPPRRSRDAPSSPSESRRKLLATEAAEVLHQEGLRGRSRTSHALSINDFEVLRPVGKGAFGKIWLARNRNNGKMYALKAMQKSFLRRAPGGLWRRAIVEKQLLATLPPHPFIVRWHGCFQNDEAVFLVLTHVGGGNIETLQREQYEQRLAEPAVRFLAAEVLLALEHLHAHDIIFRDLKPQNVLIDVDGHSCLADFGTAAEFESNNEGAVAVLASPTRNGDAPSFPPTAAVASSGGSTGSTGAKLRETICGSPQYMAPEVMRGQGYGREVDYWSFGVMLYTMLSGIDTHPFDKTQDSLLDDDTGAGIDAAVQKALDARASAAVAAAAASTAAVAPDDDADGGGRRRTSGYWDPVQKRRRRTQGFDERPSMSASVDERPTPKAAADGDASPMADSEQRSPAAARASGYWDPVTSRRRRTRGFDERPSKGDEPPPSAAVAPAPTEADLQMMVREVAAAVAEAEAERDGGVA